MFKERSSGSATVRPPVCSPSQDFYLCFAVRFLAVYSPSCCLARPLSSLGSCEDLCEVMGVKRKGSDKQRGRWGDLGQEVPMVASECLSADSSLTHPLRPLSRQLSCFPRSQPSLLS